MLQQFNMMDCYPYTTPANPDVKLIHNTIPFSDTNIARNERQKYQSLVGTLQ